MAVTKPSSGESPIAEPRSYGPLIAAICVGCLWVGFLAVLTLTTANPVTLNRAQLEASTKVTLATVVGEKTIAPVKNGNESPAELEDIQVLNLPQTGARIGQSYLFPLIPAKLLGEAAEGDFLVTPTLLPNQTPLIYPDSPETTQQLEQLRVSQAPK
jgi:hypothetical protein